MHYKISNIPALQEDGKVPFPPEVVEYISAPDTASNIAAKYGITAATLTGRVKKWGVPLRGRGRKPDSGPNVKHRLILSLTRFHTYEEVAQKVGCSKQRIHQIVQRWKHLLADSIQENSEPKIRAELPPVDVQPIRKHQAKSSVIPRPPRETRPHVVSFRLSTMLNSSLVDARKSLGLKPQTSRNQIARAIVYRFLTGPNENLQTNNVVKA